MLLPPKVRIRNGAYHYDLGRDENGKRRSQKLSRVSDGEHELYKALANITSPRAQTLNDLLDRYMARGMIDLQPATQKDYCGYIRRSLRPVFGNERPDDITSSHIAQFLQLRLEGDAGKVANKEIACLSSVFSYGMRLGLCERNPCYGVRRNRQKPRERYVRDDEFRKAFDTAPEAFQDFMAALYLTGLRQGDVRQLRRSQIEPKGIRIEQSKTGKVLYIEMTEALRYFIIRAQSRAPKSPFVFTNTRGEPWTKWAVQSQSRRLRAATGNKSWTLHDIRAKAESDHDEGLGLLSLYKRARRIKPVR